MEMLNVGPPTPEQEAFLETILSRPTNPDGTFSLGEVRGFLFAVAAGPDLVQPSEWMPVIFDGEEPVYEDMQEVQQAMGTLMSLYNEANELVRSRGNRAPRGCEFREDVLANLEPDAPISEWSRGFAAGHLWLEESWDAYLIDEMEEEMGAVLMTLSFFGSRSLAEGFLRESDNPDATLETHAAIFQKVFSDAIAGYAQMSMAIREAVAEIEPDSSATAGTRSQVGRNQPCPCGSGKKYKRCCGMKVH